MPIPLTRADTSVICPPQKTPFNQKRGVNGVVGDGEGDAKTQEPFDRDQEIFSKTWWLFFNKIAEAIRRLFGLITGNFVVYEGFKGRKVLDAVMLTGEDTVTSATANWTSADEGLLTVVRGAGADYTDLGTRIVRVISSSEVQVADTAGSDSSGVMAWGADNRAAMQQAIDSFRFVWVPIGIYLFSGKVNFYSTTHLQGFCRDVEFWDTDSTEYFFEYLTPIQDAAYDVNSAIQFENFTLFAKYGIKINDETIPTPPDHQGQVLHVAFRNVNFQGYYSTDGTWGEFLRCTDPDDSTDVEPTWADMIAFGVGINLSQCFGMTLDTYSLIQHFGIGILLNNSDESVINGNRITQNGHNIGIRGVITSGLGNTNKILNNALGANRRVGCIRQEQAVGTVVQRNYFETYSDACRFMWSYNSIGLNWSGNRVDNPNYPPFAGHTVTTPICFIDDWNSVLVQSNYMGENGYPVPVMSFGYTYWTPVFNLAQYVVIDNTLHWPTPGTIHPLDGTLSPVIAGVQTTAAMDPYRFSADNLPSPALFGSTPFPWEINAGTGRWATIKTAGSAELSFRFPLQNVMYRRFALRFTVQNQNGGMVGGVAGVTVKYIGASTTTIGTFALDPTTTTGMDIREVAVTIPGGEVGDGLIEVLLATQYACWEEVLLIPIDEATGYVLNYGPTSSYDPITGTVATATASTNQHNFPIYDLVDIDRVPGEEIGSIRISQVGALAKKFFMGWWNSIGSAGGGFLQAVTSSVTYRPIALNPLGGAILVGTSTDDAANVFQVTGDSKLSGNLNVTSLITNGSLTGSRLVKTDSSKVLVSAAAGFTGNVNVLTNINVSSTTIQYLDWTSTPQSAVLLTNVTGVIETWTFDVGQRTA